MTTHLRMAFHNQYHLVLLPGLDGTGHLFDPLLSVLPPTLEASVVRYPSDRDLSDRDLIACVRSVIPWDRPYVVVGESTAGPLALRFAHAQHENVQAVVLAASFVSDPLRQAQSWATSLFSKPWLEREPTPPLVRKYLLGEDAPEVLVDRTVHALRSLKPEVWAARTRRVRETDAVEVLRSCERPILYLQAAQDQFVGKEAAEEVRRVKPSARIVAIPGPHLLLQRSPRQALEAIRDFLGHLPAI